MLLGVNSSKAQSPTSAILVFYNEVTGEGATASIDSNGRERASAEMMSMLMTAACNYQTDPPGTAVVVVPCDRCDEVVSRPLTHYFDAQGRWFDGMRDRVST
jgi:hypothetical protein